LTASRAFSKRSLSAWAARLALSATEIPSAAKSEKMVEKRNISVSRTLALIVMRLVFRSRTKRRMRLQAGGCPSEVRRRRAKGVAESVCKCRPLGSADATLPVSLFDFRLPEYRAKAPKRLLSALS